MKTLFELLGGKPINHDDDQIDFDQHYHFIAISVTSVTKHEALNQCIANHYTFDMQTRNLSKTRSCKVFYVPVSIHTPYSIDCYLPDVEGTTYLYTIQYNKPLPEHIKKRVDWQKIKDIKLGEPR